MAAKHVFLTLLICIAIASIIFGFYYWLRLSSLNPKAAISEVFHLNSNSVLHTERYSQQQNELNRAEFTWAEFLSLRHHKGSKNIDKHSHNSCSLTHQDELCSNANSDNYIISWKRTRIGDLCEASASSKIRCLDSPSQSRMCMFENAMFNFRKVRQRVRKRNTDFGNNLDADRVTRQWERGFLTADCGYSAKENIGYLGLYKPDIEGTSDAQCDFVFNETVLAYSHRDINSVLGMINDYITVASMLWVAGVAPYSQDITFLNIDSIRKDYRFFNDNINDYFGIYRILFRRIIKARDFGPDSTVCFKRLIMQPRNVIPFMQPRNVIPFMQQAMPTEATDKSNCSVTGPSSLFQRLNLLTRQRTEQFSHEQLSHGNIIILLDSNSSFLSSTISRLQQSSLQLTSPQISVVHKDEMSIEQLATIIGSVDILIAETQSLATGAFFMNIGSSNCCGVVEIIDSIREDSSAIQLMSQQLGIHHVKITPRIDGGNNLLPLLNAIKNMQSLITRRPSCLLSNVIDNPW